MQPFLSKPSLLDCIQKLKIYKPMKKILVLALTLGLFTKVSAQEKKDYPVGTFDEISVGWAYEVVLKQSDKPFVIIEADKEILSKTEVKVKGTELTIIFTDNTWNSRMGDKAVVTIGYTSLKALDLSGAANLTCGDIIKSNGFEIEMSGAAKADLAIETQKLDIELSGASDLDITGVATQQDVDVSGASSYNAEGVKSDIVAVEASGASNAKVNAAKELTADSSGASTIKYSGNPDRTNIDSSGAGNVKKN